jgi:hypothetical protein
MPGGPRAAIAVIARREFADPTATVCLLPELALFLSCQGNKADTSVLL